MVDIDLTINVELLPHLCLCISVFLHVTMASADPSNIHSLSPFSYNGITSVSWNTNSPNRLKSGFDHSLCDQRKLCQCLAGLIWDLIEKFLIREPMGGAFGLHTKQQAQSSARRLRRWICITKFEKSDGHTVSCLTELYTTLSRKQIYASLIKITLKQCC